jgi:lipopolysaccharide/colanic/teichoic acid biosynthesis glycosyltransferase
MATRSGLWSEKYVPTFALQRDRRLYFLCKRLLDLAVAVSMLVVLGPLLLCVALLVKIDSPGPAILAQPRLGGRRRKTAHGEEWLIDTFTCFKFRTIRCNCAHSQHEAYMTAFIEGHLPEAACDRPEFKSADDPRVTRVGRWLRKTSIDELPQLWNVLRGHMSMAGPRPSIEYEVRKYEDWHCNRLAGLPGITGLWQIRGRSQVSFDEMVRLDCQYLQNQSLWLDIQILLLTIPAVLSGRGAR